ncbi:hypothetical protein J7E62_02485 [Variovorax paradoxus]|nr:hypothetical protein [Variovorax paradoxus]
MAQRLHELAENPLPTPQELAEEFDIQWRAVPRRVTSADDIHTDYQAVSVGRPLNLLRPLSQNSSSVALRDWGEERSLSLSVDTVALCVSSHTLSTALSKAPWSFNHRPNPAGSHYSPADYHETNKNGQIVQVWMQGAGCIETFTIVRYGPGIKPKIFLGKK